MTITLAGKVYPVHIVHRAKKRIILRFKDEQFFVSMPKRTSQAWLAKQLHDHGERLIQKIKAIPVPFNASGLYLYGEWVPYMHMHQHGLKRIDGPFSYQEKAWQPLKKSFQAALLNRVHHWQKKLAITTPYQIRVRHMQTRLGSNSRKTKRLTFAYKLIHFAWPIIDAVIVHELMHDRHFDHSPRFYQALYDAYPAYPREHGKILKGQYQ